MLALIRQFNLPHIIFTKSVYESSKIPLIQVLQQRDENRFVTKDEVKEMTKAERSKIMKKYPIDVVNHLDALFIYIILGWKKNISLGKHHIEDYLYRVKFQKRGNARIHCLFWLGLKDGQLSSGIDGVIRKRRSR